MSNVLVVGGAGYIGGGLTDRIIEAGHDVRVFDVLLYEDHYLKEVEFVRGNVLEETSLAPHLRWADVVVWLAAMVGDGACALDPELTRAINIGAVRRLVECFDGRIIFVSTCSVYGAQEALLTEDSPVRPLSLYAQTKLEAEVALAEANAIVFRLGTIYGLGDTYSRIRMDLVLNLLTVKAVLHRSISVFGGNQYRPLLHVRDVAQAVLPNLESDHRGIFNLHSENLTIRELADRVGRFVEGTETDLTDLPSQDVRSYRVSSEKARASFGFTPHLTVEYGIREIAKVVTEGRISDVSTPRYSNLDFLRPLLVPERSPLGVEVVARHPFQAARSPVPVTVGADGP